MSSAPPTFFHAIMRPCVLQILRATGYYGSRPTVVDTLTDLSVSYLLLLCQKTALHATDNGHEFSPDVVDLRMALQDVGALMPEKPLVEQMLNGEEDTRGMDNFLAWFEGRAYKAIMALPLFDGETEAPDYLTALKTKHSKTGEDTKYVGTALGRGTDHGEIIAEGGGDDLISIQKWEEKIRGPATPLWRDGKVNGEANAGSRPPSSQLSSVGDQLDNAVDIDMTVQEIV